MIQRVLFKLKHDVANDTELALARLELDSVVGSDFKEIKNLGDLIGTIPMLRNSAKRAEPTRIQDVLRRMSYPGECQGYMSSSLPEAIDRHELSSLTFFREVFVFFRGSPGPIVSRFERRLKRISERKRCLSKNDGTKQHSKLGQHSHRNA